MKVFVSYYLFFRLPMQNKYANATSPLPASYYLLDITMSHIINEILNLLVHLHYVIS